VNPEGRIRNLLLAGDNRLKQGHDPRTLAKAREAYEEALRVAREQGLAHRVRPLVEARLVGIESLGDPS